MDKPAPGLHRHQVQSADVVPEFQPAPVLRQFAQMVATGGAPFLQRPPAGYARGIDFYSAAALVRVLRASAATFRKAHGRWPEIADPHTFTDKIFWSKFFRPMKVPQTGNKLETAHFIPDELRSIIACPEIVWHSRTAKIPRGGDVEPGDYYLKASHGSDMFRRVTYPISEAEADRLDALFAGYLSTRFGLASGEWWYNSFAPEVLLEKAIGEGDTVSWDYFAFGEEVPLLAAYQKTAKGPLKIYLTPDFKPVPGQTEHVLEFTEPSDSAKAIMLDVTRAIGKAFSFVRVDFLLDDEGKPWLGEVTFTPGNALTRRPPEQDRALGAMWDLSMDGWSGIAPRAAVRA